MALSGTLDLSPVHADAAVAAFSESPSRYVLEVTPSAVAAVQSQCAKHGVECAHIGTLDSSARLRARGLDIDVPTLARAWLTPLDW